MFALCHSMCYGQITHVLNAPRSGDRYNLKQVEYINPGVNGRNVVWDFSTLNSTGMAFQKEYFLSTDSVLSCADDDGVIRFSLTPDSLCCLGYETRLKHMEYTDPMKVMSYPLEYGDSSVSHYSGIGDYCKRLVLKNAGTRIVEADAEGKIINCEGDTLNNVIRVHTTRLNSISMHTLSDTLLADTSHIKLEIEERYEWYVKGYRYPMYETTSICFYDNMTPVSYIHKAYYYSPDDLSELSDPVNEEMLTNNSLSETPERDIIHYSISNDVYSLTVDYSLDADANINVIICNSRGMLYGRRNTRQPAGTGYQMSFNIASLPKGEYVLYLNVNGKVYNKKFSK